MGRIAGAIAAVALVAALVGGIVGAVQRYAHARGEAEALQAQREVLRATLRTVNVQRDSLQAANDTIGIRADSANARAQRAEGAVGVEAASNLDSLIAEARDGYVPLARALRQDSLRLVQIDSLRVVERRQDATITQLRSALAAERANYADFRAAAAAERTNLELQVAAFERAAQTSWVEDLKGSADWLLVGAAVGFGACKLWCPE